jgi:hypothetical protein
LPEKPLATTGLQGINRETLRAQSSALLPAPLAVKTAAGAVVKVAAVKEAGKAVVKVAAKAAGKVAEAKVGAKAVAKGVDKAAVAAEDEDAPDNCDGDENTTFEPIEHLWI